MIKYIVKRILLAVLTIWAVVTITFVLMKLIPGNPFASEGNMSRAAFENMMRYYNLDKPIFIQYI